jgi:lysophospholipase L1-like esterase
MALGLAVFNHGLAKALCPEKLTGFWKLDDSNPALNGLLDSSGGGNNGACTVCPTYTTTGLINQAQVFDGTSTGIDVPADTAFNWNSTDSFTIEFWVNVSASHVSDSVVIGRTDPATSLEWWVGINSAGQAAALLIAADGSGSAAILTGNNDISDDLWHHVAFVRDGDANENRLFVDGTQVDAVTTTYTAGFGAPSAGLSIGWLNRDSGFHFNGTIDEVALYAKALMDETIVQHHRDGSLGLRLGYCSDDDPVKIMPLGDSITRGSYGNGSPPSAAMEGFRRSLYRSLEDVDLNGLDDYLIQFVGSQADGQNFTDFDHEHEGYSGFLASDISTQVYGYLDNNPADVVLLHIGTNDITDGKLAAAVASDVNAILNEVDRYDPAIPVVLARIINRKNTLGQEYAETSVYNSALQTLAENRIASGDRILVVDHEPALAPSDMSDDVHPNQGGYGKMANVWYAGLVTLLPPTNYAVPTITSLPVERANLNSLYSYAAEADGNEAPVFVLTEPSPLPDDMDIDPATGTITWTPASYTPVDMVVEATNSHGTDTQSFRITVGNSPIAVNDAYGPDDQAYRLDIAAAEGVLKNDTDSDLDTLQAVLLTDVSRGTLTLQADGSFTYVHDGSDMTTDSFSYRAHDGAGFSNAATVNLTVRPNTAPTITGQGNLGTSVNTPLTISPLNLVVEDPDNDYPGDFTLKVYAGSNYVVDNTTITPNPGVEGTLTVPISVNDGYDESNIYSLQVSVKGNSSSSGNGCFIQSTGTTFYSRKPIHLNVLILSALSALGMIILLGTKMFKGNILYFTTTDIHSQLRRKK